MSCRNNRLGPLLPRCVIYDEGSAAEAGGTVKLTRS